jgi:hypothetical protein
MQKLKHGLKTLIIKFSSVQGWFKRVFLHEKEEIFAYKQKELNNKFNQYYIFLEALKSHNMISVKDATESWDDVKEKRSKEEEKLFKSIWHENLDKKNK